LLQSSPANRLSARQSRLASDVGGLLTSFDPDQTCFGGCQQVRGEDMECAAFSVGCNCIFSPCFPDCPYIIPD
jgi:hypothetical protein